MPTIGQSGAPLEPRAESLGVIIALPPDLTEELSQWRARYARPDAPLVPAHITLVSGQAKGSWAEAAEHVRSVARGASAFPVSLRGTGSFAPLSEVVFLNLVTGEKECIELHQELIDGPVRHLLDFTYQPHVTIAHDLDPETMAQAQVEMSNFAADFRVESLGLYNFVNGGWNLCEELSFGGIKQR